MSLRNSLRKFYKLALFSCGVLMFTGCASNPQPDKYTFFDRQFKPDVYYSQIDFNRFLQNSFASTDAFIEKVNRAVGYTPSDGKNKLNPFIYYK